MHLRQKLLSGRLQPAVSRRVRPFCASQALSVEGVLPKTWSNPKGRLLTEVAPNLWAIEREFKPRLLLNAVDVGGKSAVVRLSDGTLWVHAPYPLDPNLKVVLDGLGPVKHIVTPNTEHTFFAQQWIDAYPTARAYACPGLREKSSTKYTDTIGVDNASPAEWLAEIECTYLGYEVNPFTGQPFFHEVVFLHKPSKTLIVTDLVWNYPNRLSGGSWWWKQGMDKVYAPFYKKFMIKDRAQFDAAMQRILSWDWDRILPCHGDVIDKDARGGFVEYFDLA
eukprot:jgi/Chrzof1/610/Cz01g22100.t1